VADRPVFGIGVCGGALGLELGLEAAIPNYRTVCVVERETAVAGRMAQRIKEGSLPELAWWDDVKSFDGRPWRGIVSVLSAGFPCQPFSVAGKRKGKEDERWIWPDIARVIEELGEELEIVFLENVPGLLLSTHSDFDRWDLESSPENAVGGFGTVFADLARLRFHAEWLSLRVSDVGASHGRKRVFILAYRDRARLGRYAWQHDGRPMADTGRAGIGRASQSAGFYRGGPSDDDRAVPLVGNPNEPGYPVRGDDSGLRECAPVERTGDAVGNAARDHERHVGEHAEGCQIAAGGSSVHVGNALSARSVAQQPGCGSRNPDCEPSGNVADPSRSELDGREGEAGRIGRRGVFKAGEQLGDSTRGGFGERGEPSERIGQPDGAITDVEHATRAEGARLEQLRDILSGPPDIFAPGPAFAGWESLLVRYPWLRPSYSQAEAESDFRDMADGMASLVAGERTGALRALGNGVVPLQAGVAFTILLRRVLSANG
jgi:DNA (cytosine-5)-methyltransferase 1